jgi:hypothetical protein
MGADLITYIAIGPPEITPHRNRINDLTEDILDLQQRIRDVADTLLVEGEAEIDEGLPDLSADRSMSIPMGIGDLPEIDHRDEIDEYDDATDLRRSVCQRSGIGAYAEVLGMTPTDIRETIEEFVQTWNGEIAWRNLAFRPMPDRNQKIVVAGERTMGDEPGGAYAVLKKGFAFGIADHFRIK